MSTRDSSWVASTVPRAKRQLPAHLSNKPWPRVNPSVPLRYGLLLGDASYDYKNSYGYPQSKNLLSTYMRSVSTSSTLGYMSDESYFSTVSGTDAIPDLFLGRWPVHSVAETNAVAQKILSYETSPPGQPWRSNVVFVADDSTEVNRCLPGPDPSRPSRCSPRTCR